MNVYQNYVPLDLDLHKFKGHNGNAND